MRHAASFLIPVSLITLYYAFWVGFMVLLLLTFPAIHDFFPVGGLGELAEDSETTLEPIIFSVEHTVWASFAPVKLICASIGAVILIVPVSWVYFITSRTKEVDQSFVQTILIMPIVVTGISMIVMNSIALAFSLAGLAVRFRFTLRSPSDTMYIFTAISVGLGAGIGALDISAVISAAFVYVTLVIWKLEYGKTFSGTFFSMLARRNRDEEEY